MKTLVRLFAILLVSSIGSAQTTRTAVKTGRVLDVRTGAYIEQAVILIEDGRIVSVGRNVAIPAAATVVDLSGMTVLPGLIDCHTHLTFDPGGFGYSSLGISVPREALRGAKNARLTLEAGFTTVRNVGSHGYTDIALRDAIDAGDVARAADHCGRTVPWNHGWSLR